MVTPPNWTTVGSSDSRSNRTTQIRLTTGRLRLRTSSTCRARLESPWRTDRTSSRIHWQRGENVASAKRRVHLVGATRGRTETIGDEAFRAMRSAVNDLESFLFRLHLGIVRRHRRLRTPIVSRHRVTVGDRMGSRRPRTLGHSCRTCCPN